MENKNYLTEAFIGTLSEMAFLDATLTEKEEESFDHDRIGHKLTILRPFAEEIFVFFPKRIVAEMVENMFEEQENIHAPEVIFDCVAEFLNVFAGKYFQLATPEKLFELGLPQEATPGDLTPGFKHANFKTLSGDIISVYHKLS